MLLVHERDYVLGMDALIIECTALEPDPSLSALARARYDGSGMDVLIIECARTRPVLWFGHGCFHDGVHSNTIVIMVWAWMLW